MKTISMDYDEYLNDISGVEAKRQAQAEEFRSAIEAEAFKSVINMLYAELLRSEQVWPALSDDGFELKLRAVRQAIAKSAQDPIPGK